MTDNDVSAQESGQAVWQATSHLLTDHALFRKGGQTLWSSDDAAVLLNHLEAALERAQAERDEWHRMSDAADEERSEAYGRWMKDKDALRAELQQAREEREGWMMKAGETTLFWQQAEAALTEAHVTAQNYADEWQMVAWDRDRLKGQLTEAQGKAALAELSDVFYKTLQEAKKMRNEGHADFMAGYLTEMLNSFEENYVALARGAVQEEA